MASSRAMVLLPLPLSPASATISRSLITRSALSTACKLVRENALPMVKCRVSFSVRNRGSGMDRTLRVQQAPHLDVADGVQGRLDLDALRHDHRTSWAEPAPGRRIDQLRWVARNAGHVHARPPDGRERLQQALAVRVGGRVEHGAGVALLGHLA